MILALWAAAAAHTLIFYTISYMITRPRRTTIAGSLFAALTVAGTALPILACGQSGCASGTLSISRTVSPLPWCVVFGVLLALAGIAGAFALRDFGCPLIGAAALASLVCVAAFPDRGGWWSMAHIAAVLLMCACAALFAIYVVADRGRIAHVRTHVVAGAACAAVSASCVYRSDQPNLIRGVGMVAEMASLMHIGACLA